MIRGIGVDTVDIDEIRRFLNTEALKKSFVTHTFTKEERLAAERCDDPPEYLATRFAVKEAVYKAVAHLTPEKTFDMRIVETLNREDGSPYISVSKPMAEVLKSSDTDILHISITTENHYATAFVIGEKSYRGLSGISSSADLKPEAPMAGSSHRRS